MPVYAIRPGSGVDRHTGKPVSGWKHVENSLECIFQTYFGLRPLRRWFGSFVPRLLGENISPQIVVQFFTSIYVALELEPRFQLSQVRILSTPDELRLGRLRIGLEGFYLPRGHLDDFTSEGARLVVVEWYGQAVNIQRDALQGGFLATG